MSGQLQRLRRSSARWAWAAGHLAMIDGIDGWRVFFNCAQAGYEFYSIGRSLYAG
jgi:hypothetical protein